MKRARRSDVAIGRWRMTGGATSERTVAYKNARSPLVHEHRAVERQTLRSLRDDGGLCVVDASTVTADVPWGDAFYTKVRYTLRAVEAGADDAAATELVVSWEVEWKPGRSSRLTRGIVGTGAAKGLRRNFESYAALLDTYLKPKR